MKNAGDAILLAAAKEDVEYLITEGDTENAKSRLTLNIGKSNF